MCIRDRFGGSHGGYLISKLIEDERIASKIKASVLLNPVIFLNFMIHNSDIPEWAYATFLGKEKNLSQMVSLVTLDHT